MMFNCERCGFKTCRKNNLKNHLTRKFPCTPDLKDIPIETLLTNFNTNVKKLFCKFCDRSYSHQSGLSRHQSKCKPNPLETKIMKKLEEKLALLMSTKTTKNSTSNPGSNNNISQKNAINPYNSEPLQLTMEEFNKYISNLPTKTIMKMVQDLNFNPEKPEDMNFYISNLKDKIGKIYDGSEWKNKDSCELVDEVYQKYKETIENIFDEIYQMSDCENKLKTNHNMLISKVNTMFELWCKRTKVDGFELKVTKDLTSLLHEKKKIVKQIHK